MTQIGWRIAVAPMALAALLAMPTTTAGQWRNAAPGMKRWSDLAYVPRHRFVTDHGVPEPYRSMVMPPAASDDGLTRGRKIYEERCRSCHGAQGKGNGPSGRQLSPLPFDVAWLAEMKLSRYDGFMYWSIAEGGRPFSTMMPAFRDVLTPADIWAVALFIR